MRRLAVREVSAEFPIFDNVRALRRNAFIVIGKRAEPLPMIQPRVRHDVHDARGVFQLVQLVKRQKTCAREIRFLSQDAVEFDRMPNRFVNLQTELVPRKNQGAEFFRALGRGMKRGRFFRNHRRMLHQVQRINQFVAFQRMLPAKTVGIRAFLNFFALERGRPDAAPGNHFALVYPRTNAGREPRIDLAKLHVRFRQRDALHLAHFRISGKQQRKLRL